MPTEVYIKGQWVSSSDIGEMDDEQLLHFRDYAIELMDSDRDVKPRGIAFIMSRINAEIGKRDIDG